MRSTSAGAQQPWLFSSQLWKHSGNLSSLYMPRDLGNQKSRCFPIFPCRHFLQKCCPNSGAPGTDVSRVLQHSPITSDQEAAAEADSEITCRSLEGGSRATSHMHLNKKRVSRKREGTRLGVVVTAQGLGVRMVRMHAQPQEGCEGFHE